LLFVVCILATGKLSPEAIPGKLNIIEDTSCFIYFFRCIGYLKMQGCLLGLEFSGLDSAGQRVMGLLSAKGKIPYFHFSSNYTTFSFSSLRSSYKSCN
jgi:hypothetical protein